MGKNGDAQKTPLLATNIVTATCTAVGTVQESLWKVPLTNLLLLFLFLVLLLMIMVMVVEICSNRIPCRPQQVSP